MGIKLAVTGISYGHSSRLAGFASLLGEMDDYLNLKHSILLWQPDTPLEGRTNFFGLLWADIFFTRFGYRKMFRRIESLLGSPIRIRLLRECAFIVKLPLVIRYFDPRYRRLRQELRSREVFLNAKHRMAWMNFLEGDCDLLLVLEDDVHPTDSQWKQRLLNSIDTAGNLTSKPSILNLAPFFSLGNLIPELRMQEVPERANWRRFYFYANTTAGYIINRRAAELLLAGFLTSPKLNLESIDFAMTMVGLRSSSDIEYFERHPAVFDNLSQVEGLSSLGN